MIPKDFSLSVLIYCLPALSILIEPHAISATFRDLEFKLEFCEFAQVFCCIII